ncbi:MAG: S9 family peptidase, partial [Bacteroidota bacterium]
MKKFVVVLALAFLIVPQFAQDKLLTVEQIYGSGEFSTKSVQGVRWLGAGERFSYQEADASAGSVGIWSHTVADGSKELIVDTKDLVLEAGDPPFRFTSYQWSPDERRILFVSAPPERQYLSRLTPAGNFFLFDLPSGQFRRLTNVSVPQYNQKFSPDGTTLGFVRENNIILLDLETGNERHVTTDGSATVINGKFDWVYEEEFGISDGWLWSPDGKSIAYWQLDEERVPQFHMVDHLSLRSETITMKYPKAGDPNAIVRVGVVALETGKTVWMDLGGDDDIYVPRIYWPRTPNALVLFRLNRWQNRAELLLGNSRTGATTVFFTEEEKTWVNVDNDVRFLRQKDQFLWSSERDGYRHLYLFDMKGKMVRQLTKGKWEITGLSGFNEAEGVAYVTAGEKSIFERHLYEVRLDGKGVKRITQGDFSYGVNLAPGGSAFIGTFSKYGTAPTTALFGRDGKLLRTLAENPMESLQEYRLGTGEFFSFKTRDGVELNGWMLKPKDFDPARKYPVLLHVYGGPGSQTVTNSWGGANYLWYQMLTQKGYIVASVDNRGTGMRGKAFRSVTYQNLGKWEVHDQVEAAKYLGSLPFIEKSRIGIWGWSYGGYMASLTILLGADYFKAAVAVAPVTHWKFYDTIYTERYMRRPQDNEAGYREGAP